MLDSFGLYDRPVYAAELLAVLRLSRYTYTYIYILCKARALGGGGDRAFEPYLEIESADLAHTWMDARALGF